MEEEKRHVKCQSENSVYAKESTECSVVADFPLSSSRKVSNFGSVAHPLQERNEHQVSNLSGKGETATAFTGVEKIVPLRVEAPRADR